YTNSSVGFSLFPSMDIARLVHFIFMYILVTVALYKLFYVFHQGDLVKLIFRLRDLRSLPELIKYYIFLSKSMPTEDKYNPGQKATYTLWFFLIVVQALTGFILYWPGPLGYLGHLLGGMSLVRLVHYLVTWVFVSTVIVHVYLVFITGGKLLIAMITGSSPQVNKKHTE
ncbi:MAG: cytochrome b/b6 domain-containing protein, partial [Clostridia bacterium]|nr:cytochrome b/b6 domain-containing protein [Clostridia bacterium]